MKRRMIKSILISLFAIFVPVSLVFGAEPIKVGIVWPLTGPIAASGSYLKGGAEIARDKINAEGGILGRPLRLMIEDGANDPAQSVSAAEKLVTRDKIDVIIAAWGSSPTLAVSSSVTRKYGIPHVVETATADKVTNDGGKRPNPWLFRTSPTNRVEAEGVEKYLVSKMGFSQVAMLAVNNDWGRGMVEELTTVLKRSGGKVTAVEFINQDANEFLTQLGKINSSGANSIIITTEMVQVAEVLKQAKQLTMKQKILTTAGGVVPEGLIDLAGKEAAEGVYILRFNSLPLGTSAPGFEALTKIPEEAKWFVNEFLKRGNSVKGMDDGYRSYDALKAIKTALEIAKTTDKEKVREAFYRVDVWGLTGPIKFDEFGQSRPSINCIQIKNGKAFLPDFLTQ